MSNPPALKHITSQSPASSASGLRLMLVLAGVFLLTRLVGLMQLPIFGDEAIYLRWAQLVRGEGVDRAYPWISLADPKPPLHFWLMAAFFRFTSDPLLAARLISVLTGVISIPLVMAVGRELSPFFRESKFSKSDGIAQGHLLGIVTAALFVFCPFLAFYQRLATADALFVCQSLLIIWLSLRWARTVVNGEKRSWPLACVLGLAIGAGFLTRQGLSYTICIMPIAAWMAHARLAAKEIVSAPTRMQQPRFTAKAAAQLFAAAAIAFFLWFPYLTAELNARATDAAQEARGTPATATSADYYKEIKRRIMYQDSFTGGNSQRLAVALRNIRVTFFPGWTNSGPNSGWYYLYLTPPVYLLCLAGLIYLAFAQRFLFLFILIWILALLAPVILLGSTIYSRYTLAAVPPLLFAAAYVLLRLTGFLLNRKPLTAWLLTILLWGLAIGWPMKEMAAQAAHWPDQTMTEAFPAANGIPGVRGDRYQYITGWTAGLATRRAIHELNQFAAVGPIIVITGEGSGTPADAIWAYLDNDKNVTLYYTDGAIPQPGIAWGSFRLHTDKLLYSPPRDVQFPDGIPLFLVIGDPIHAARADIPAKDALAPLRANLLDIRSFYGVEGKKGEGVALAILNARGSLPAPPPPSRKK